MVARKPLNEPRFLLPFLRKVIDLALWHSPCYASLKTEESKQGLHPG